RARYDIVFPGTGSGGTPSQTIQILQDLKVLGEIQGVSGPITLGVSLRLNGLPPGEPVIGRLTLASPGAQEIAAWAEEEVTMVENLLLASPIACDPTKPTTIRVLSSGSQLVADPLTELQVQGIYNGTGTFGLAFVPEPAASAMILMGVLIGAARARRRPA